MRCSTQRQRSDASLIRGPVSFELKITGVPDQRCTIRACAHAAPRPGHGPTWLRVTDPTHSPHHMRRIPMDVFEAVATRHSCRAFLPTPIPEATIRDIIERASRAPSAGNMQPWRIYAIAGERVEALKALLAPRMNELPKGEGGDYRIFPDGIEEQYRARRFAVGELLYKSINVPRA